MHACRLRGQASVTPLCERAAPRVRPRAMAGGANLMRARGCAAHPRVRGAAAHNALRGACCPVAAPVLLPPPRRVAPARRTAPRADMLYGDLAGLPGSEISAVRRWCMRWQRGPRGMQSGTHAPLHAERFVVAASIVRSCRHADERARAVMALMPAVVCCALFASLAGWRSRTHAGYTTGADVSHGSRGQHIRRKTAGAGPFQPAKCVVRKRACHPVFILARRAG